MLLWTKEEKRDARDAFGDFLFSLFYIRAAAFLFSFQGQICDKSQSKSADVQLAEDVSWIFSKSKSWVKASPLPLSPPAKVYPCPVLCVIVYLIIQQRCIDFESSPTPFRWPEHEILNRSKIVLNGSDAWLLQLFPKVSGGKLSGHPSAPQGGLQCSFLMKNF